MCRIKLNDDIYLNCRVFIVCRKYARKSDLIFGGKKKISKRESYRDDRFGITGKCKTPEKGSHDPHEAEDGI